ncbi:MAG: hypothetical protein IPG96_15760 [Proteobacteria bacterium]|nr:hypothetical protein [Pseudomonadota bacterium]
MTLPLPLQFLIAMIAHAINTHLARRVEYLIEEVRVMRGHQSRTGVREEAQRPRSPPGAAAIHLQLTRA